MPTRIPALLLLSVPCSKDVHKQCVEPLAWRDSWNYLEIFASYQVFHSWPQAMRISVWLWSGMILLSFSWGGFSTALKSTVSQESAASFGSGRAIWAHQRRSQTASPDEGGIEAAWCGCTADSEAGRPSDRKQIRRFPAALRLRGGSFQRLDSSTDDQGSREAKDKRSSADENEISRDPERGSSILEQTEVETEDQYQTQFDDATITALDEDEQAGGEGDVAVADEQSASEDDRVEGEAPFYNGVG
jgi:hypothetical protein